MFREDPVRNQVPCAEYKRILEVGERPWSLMAKRNGKAEELMYYQMAFCVNVDFTEHSNPCFTSVTQQNLSLIHI